MEHIGEPAVVWLEAAALRLAGDREFDDTVNRIRGAIDQIRREGGTEHDRDTE